MGWLSVVMPAYGVRDKRPDGACVCGPPVVLTRRLARPLAAVFSGLAEQVTAGVG
jgi:hypothetical protein